MSRISRLEWVCGAVAVVILVGLVIAEPDVVQAPLESSRALAAVAGGTILAGVALIVMLRLRVPPVARLVVLGVPLVVVSWWTISPFFTDDIVHDDFETSIAAARRGSVGPIATDGGSSLPSTTSAGPRLLGSGAFVGLAGHQGTGDAGLFRRGNGSVVLRLENFDIDNGPDLELYLVPGADRRSADDRSHHFGGLRGNIGDQTYEVPASFPVTTGRWTVLVWCKAFTVEFVAATVTVI